MSDVGVLDQTPFELNGVIETSKQFATFIFEQKFYLTALEFHCEQLERGNVVRCLEEFFADSNNFCQIDSIRETPRRNGRISFKIYILLDSCNSHSTLDSLDRTDSEGPINYGDQIKG